MRLQPPTGPAASVTLQTPPGRGGIAVIALTGPSAGHILTEAFRPARPAQRPPGALEFGHLHDAGRTVDEAIVCRAGDVIEINVHAGPHVVRRIMELLARLGARAEPPRPSAPESFTPAHPRWNNPAVGREMLDALALAASLAVASAVTQQWSGGISKLARGLLSELPAGAPEGPAANRTAKGQAGLLRSAAGKLTLMSRLLHPPEVVLAGPPNAGKSSLANALLGRQVSIVHEQAGTTRDWVREPATLCGLPVWLTDTAGIWSGPGGLEPIEQEAVRRARKCIEAADLVLLLGAEEPPTPPAWLHTERVKVLRVASKCDLRPPWGEGHLAVSALTGQGIDQLKQAVIRALGLHGLEPSAAMAFTQRQARLLEKAAQALEADEPQAARQPLRELLEG